MNNDHLVSRRSSVLSVSYFTPEKIRRLYAFVEKLTDQSGAPIVRDGRVYQLPASVVAEPRALSTGIPRRVDQRRQSPVSMM